MSYKNSNDSRYFHMAVFIALANTAALIWLHLSEYTRGSYFTILIPVSICIALIAVSVPLMKYLNKIRKGGPKTGYFKAANLLAIFAMLSLHPYSPA
ncbi:MAG: hypothetical protein LBQ88_03920 [Treponema sp.]|jgi:hypothetical protein|nr:hypothetical protein [Treponema sp.]